MKKFFAWILILSMCACLCACKEELTDKGHNYELEECGSTVLCLDYRHNGIGSASCGPVLRREYALTDETIDFEIRIIPEPK